MVFGSVQTAFADRKDDLRNAQAAEQNQLGDTYDALNELSEQQAYLQGQISDTNAELVDLMIQISQAEADIEATRQEIEATQGAIEITLQQLAEEEAKRDKQYADMTNRIQYIYENGGVGGWATIILKADSFANLLNRAEYTTQLENADRSALEAYEATIVNINAAKDQLTAQKAALEEQKAILEAQEAALEQDRANMEALLAQMEAQNQDYANQIAEARNQAAAIEALIAEQQAEIDRIEAEEEAARRAAAEAAARAAAEEAARAAAAQSAASSSSSSSSAPAEVSYSGGGGSGQSIVDFACQYVGYPYVWGGNSLTGGIDCSHFVWQVLRATGAYSGGYRTSGGWASLGSPVSSLSAAQAGDVIVYAGHVAIYDGCGGIVEAKGAAWGITHDRRADCKAIVAIRRFV
ncbi:MAG: C40 family peptidase [Lachnospiraceae bacterium]|nr:C40 family peptidase [Candidatus Equihabitans merdae]